MSRTFTFDTEVTELNTWLKPILDGENIGDFTSSVDCEFCKFEGTPPPSLRGHRNSGNPIEFVSDDTESLHVRLGRKGVITYTVINSNINDFYDVMGVNTGDDFRDIILRFKDIVLAMPGE